MLIKRPDPIKASEITPRETFLDRRRFIARAGAIAGAATLPGLLPDSARAIARDRKSPGRTLEGVKETAYEVPGEELAVVALDGGDGEVRDVVVRDDLVGVHRVGERAEAGAEDDADAGVEFGASADGGGGLFDLTTVVHDVH